MLVAADINQSMSSQPAAAAAAAAPEFANAIKAVQFAERIQRATKTPDDTLRMGTVAQTELMRYRELVKSHVSSLTSLTEGWWANDALAAHKVTTKPALDAYLAQNKYPEFRTLEQARKKVDSYQKECAYTIRDAISHPEVDAAVKTLRAFLKQNDFKCDDVSSSGAKRKRQKDVPEHVKNLPELMDLIRDGMHLASAVKYTQRVAFGCTVIYNKDKDEANAPFRLLCVDGTPLPADAKALFDAGEPSPYGDVRNVTTKLNTNVRHSREIQSERITFTQEGHMMMADACNAANVFFAEHGSVALKPYKLIVYGEGGHFKAHLDTPRPGVVGTAILTLPYKRTGGDLKVKYRNSQFSDFASNNGERAVFSVFNSNCPHEVTAVKSGYRVSMAFFVMKDEPGKAPAADPSLIRRMLKPPTHALDAKEFGVDAIDEKALAAAITRTCDRPHKYLSVLHELEPDVYSSALVVHSAKASDGKLTTRVGDSSSSSDEGVDNDDDDGSDDDGGGESDSDSGSIEKEKDDSVKKLCNVVRRMCLEHQVPAGILLGWTYSHDECEVKAWKNGDHCMIQEFDTPKDAKTLEFRVVPVIVTQHFTKPYGKKHALKKTAVYRSTKADLATAISESPDEHEPLETTDVVFFDTRHSHGKLLHKDKEDAVEYTGNESREGYADMVYQTAALVIYPREDLSDEDGDGDAPASAAASSSADEPGPKRQKLDD